MLLLALNSSCNKNDEKVSDLDGWYSGGNADNGYETGVETEKYNGQPVYFLKSGSNTKGDFGSIMKNFFPVDYAEKRIRLSGWIKSNNVYGWAGMLLRIDGGSGEGLYGKTLCFDNMQKRPIKETTDWKKYEIVADVSKESRMLYYGAILNGKGTIWISDLKFEVVGNDVPPTTTGPMVPFPQ